MLSALAALLIWVHPPGLRIWQEIAFDSLIRLTPPLATSADAPPDQVVDIGATDEAGRPWHRAASARLAAALLAQKPAVVGWDAVSSGSCDATVPATAALETALGGARHVLGFLLSGQPLPLPNVPPTIAASREALPRLWFAPGAEMPCPSMGLAAAGLASVFLPAAVSVAGVAWPSLPVKVFRLPKVLPTPLPAGAEHDEMTLQLPEASLALDRGGAHCAFIRQAGGANPRGRRGAVRAGYAHSGGHHSGRVILGVTRRVAAHFGRSLVSVGADCRRSDARAFVRPSALAPRCLARLGGRHFFNQRSAGAGACLGAGGGLCTA